MFEKIKNFFAALFAGIVALFTVFMVFKTKKNSDLDASFDRARKEFLEKNEVMVDDYEQKTRELEKEYKEALEELSSSEQKDMKTMEEKYGKEVVEIYKKNRQDVDKLAEELSKKYGLKNV